jgi:hypothetical protein
MGIAIIVIGGHKKWAQTAIRSDLKAVSSCFYWRARRDSNPQPPDP